jgi:hypothetical protein
VIQRLLDAVCLRRFFGGFSVTTLILRGEITQFVKRNFQ